MDDYQSIKLEESKYTPINTKKDSINSHSGAVKNDGFKRMKVSETLEHDPASLIKQPEVCIFSNPRFEIGIVTTSSKR